MLFYIMGFIKKDQQNRQQINREMIGGIAEIFDGKERETAVRVSKNSGAQTGVGDGKTSCAVKKEDGGTVVSSRLKGSMGRTTYVSENEGKAAISTKKAGTGLPETSSLLGGAEKTVGASLGDGKAIGAAKKEDNESMGSSRLAGKMGKTAYGSKLVEYVLGARNVVTIGRDPDCDIVSHSPFVSRNHIRIISRSGRYFAEDLKSDAGTYLNGAPLTGSAMLQEGDCLSICDQKFYFNDGKIIHWERESRTGRDEKSAGKKPAGEKLEVGRTMVEKPEGEISTAVKPVILKADIETKRVKNNSGNGTKELIRDIHLEIKEGTLVALLGTAGAGKSTVMNCLNGMDLEGVRGRVIYRDVDLMQNFDQMKFLIGSVPQEKVFHGSFTPEEEFRIAARKRLPGDTTNAEIEARVNNTLEILSINGVRKNKIGKLSGGEKTRVNVGIELVADRDLLCMDEPEQGLSPNYREELFETMRKLAHENGKTVLAIIHDVTWIDMFDQVIMLAKADGVGQLAFAGTPEEGRSYFGESDFNKVYALLDKDPAKYVKKKA